ncbi:hypothetical protein PG989_013261 [Apiospora arundinis]
MAEIVDTAATSLIAKRINKPGRYFRTGRVFATIVMEPSSARQGSSSSGFEKIRRFIVVHEGHHLAWCVPIHTYEGRGFHKPGIRLQDHAQIYEFHEETVGRHIPLRDPIGIVIEGSDDIHRLHPASVANFGKVNSIEHDKPVVNVGFVPRVHVNRLSLKLNDLDISTHKTKMKKLRRDEGQFNVTIWDTGGLEIGELDLGDGGSLNLTASGDSKVELGSIKDGGNGFVNMSVSEGASLKLGLYNHRGPLRLSTENTASLSIENANINDGNANVITSGQSGTKIGILEGCDGAFNAVVNDLASLELNSVHFRRGTFNVSTTSRSSAINNFVGVETSFNIRPSGAASLKMDTATLDKSIFNIISKDQSTTDIKHINSVLSIFNSKTFDEASLKIGKGVLTECSSNLSSTDQSTTTIEELRGYDTSPNAKVSITASLNIDDTAQSQGSSGILPKDRSHSEIDGTTCAKILDTNTQCPEEDDWVELPPTLTLSEYPVPSSWEPQRSILVTMSGFNWLQKLPKTRLQLRELMQQVSKADGSGPNLPLQGGPSTTFSDEQSLSEPSREPVLSNQGQVATVKTDTDLAQPMVKGDTAAKVSEASQPDLCRPQPSEEYDWRTELGRRILGLRPVKKMHLVSDQLEGDSQTDIGTVQRRERSSRRTEPTRTSRGIRMRLENDAHLDIGQFQTEGDIGVDMKGASSMKVDSLQRSQGANWRPDQNYTGRGIAMRLEDDAHMDIGQFQTEGDVDVDMKGASRMKVSSFQRSEGPDEYGDTRRHEFGTANPATLRQPAPLMPQEDHLEYVFVERHANSPRCPSSLSRGNVTEVDED